MSLSESSQFALPSQNTLAAGLWTIAHKAIDEIARAKEAKQLALIQEPYLRKSVLTFSEREDGSQQSEWRQDLVPRAEWQWMAGHSIEQRLRDTDEFKTCLTSLAREFSDRTDRAEFDLFKFVEAVFQRAVTSLPDAEVSELIATFVADLHLSPCDIVLNARLVGIGVKGADSVEFERCKLRKVERRDLEYERPLKRLFFPTSKIDAFPRSILTFQTRAVSMGDAQRELLQTQRALSLFRLGSVRYLDYECQMRSILRFGGNIGSGDESAPFYQFDVSPSDTALLAKFLATFEPLLPDPFDTDLDTAAAGIAFERYSDALFKAGPIDSRITLAITCLEALFFKRAERSELTFKLGVRVAALLRAAGMNPLTVQRDVTQAYGIRSTYIHGGVMSKKQTAEAADLCRRILEYARVSLQVFLQRKTSSEKETLISKIDQSLLDETLEVELGEVVSTSVLTP